MTLELVRRDDGQLQSVWTMDKSVLPDLHLIPRIIQSDEIVPMDSRELAWEISRRILLVQRWARYYGCTTTALVVLATGLMPSTRR